MDSSRHEDAVGHPRVEVHVVVEGRAEAVAGETPPSRGRDARGVLAASATPAAASSSRSISARKIFVSRDCVKAGLLTPEAVNKLLTHRLA